MQPAPPHHALAAFGDTTDDPPDLVAREAHVGDLLHHLLHALGHARVRYRSRARVVGARHLHSFTFQLELTKYEYFVWFQ